MMDYSIDAAEVQIRAVEDFLKSIPKNIVVTGAVEHLRRLVLISRSMLDDVKKIEELTCAITVIGLSAEGSDGEEVFEEVEEAFRKVGLSV